MPIIKGPMTFKNTDEMLDKIKGEVEIKLPFEATGWHSTRNANLVKGGKKATKEEIIAMSKKTEPKKKTKIRKGLFGRKRKTKREGKK